MHRFLPFFLLGLALTPLPYLSTLLDPDSALFYRDLTNVQIPLKAEWIRAVHELARVPFWDHFHFGGIPFLADASYGPLYPLNVFFAPFAPESAARALVYFIVLHHLGLFAGGFWLSRELRARPLVCLIGGLAFAWCGYAMSSDNLLHLLGGQLAFPVAFVLWRRTLRRRAIGASLALAALALAWPVYAGDPQFALIAFAACAVLALMYRRGLRALAMLAVLAGFAAAPQLAPILRNLLADGTRLASASLESQTVWRLHPWRLLELVFPSPFVSTPDEALLRGAQLVNGPHGGGVPFFFSFYAGAVPVASLALYLTLRFSKRSRLRATDLWPAIAFATIALLATGSPLYALFFRVVPLWRGFRYPERLGYWLVAPLLIGGIFSLERLLRLRGRPGRAAAAPLLGFALLAALALSAGGSYALVGAGALATVAALAAITLPFRGRAAALAALAAIDLFLSAHRLVWPQSLAVLEPANLPPARELLSRFETERKELELGGPRRFLSYYELKGIDPALTARASLLALDTAEAWIYLRANTAAYFGIENVVGHGSLMPERAYLFEPCTDAACETRTAELLAVRYALRADAAGRPSVEAIAGSLPFAFFPTSFSAARSAREAFLQARATGFDYRRTAVVENGAPRTVLAPPEVLEVHRDWDRIRVRIAPAREPSMLVVNEGFDPYWTAIGALDVRRVNGWAMGVELPARNEPFTVELVYRDRSFYFGVALFFVWVAGLCGLFIRSRVMEGAAIGPRQVRV